MAIENTDLFLVARGGTNYKQEASDIMAIQDTDLLLVARGGTNYKATGAELLSYAAGGPARNWKPSGTGLPAGSGFSKVAYSNGRFVGVISGNTYISTDDGLTWSLGGPLPSGASLIARTASGFITGSGADGNIPLYTSPNGTTWTQSGQLPGQVGYSNYVNSITYSPNSQNGGPANLITSITTENFLFAYPQAHYLGNPPTNPILSWTPSFDVSGNISAMRTFGAVVSLTSGFVLVGSYGILNPLDPQPQYSGVWGYGTTPSAQTSPVFLAGASGTNSGYAVYANGEAVTVLNSSSLSVNTTVCIITNPTDPSGSGIVTAQPGVGTNALLSGDWEPDSNTIVFTGTGGCITVSYDGGVTWLPCSLQYEVPGLASQSLVTCAASPTCFITSSSTTVLRATI